MLRILFTCTFFLAVFFAEANYRGIDTLGKNWQAIPKKDSDSASQLVQYHLDNNPIFQEYWINDVLFVYEDFTSSQLADTITINLIDSTKEEKFQLTWYGAVNSPYGPRWGRMHRGVDLYLKTGDTVVSAFDGIVRYAQFNTGGYGNCVIIRHFNGLETLYGHLSKIEVAANQMIKAGELIGLGGSTGRSDGPHLHFETRYKDYSFDPYIFIDKLTNQLNTSKLVIPKKLIAGYRYPGDTKNAINVKEYAEESQINQKKYWEGKKSKTPPPKKKSIKSKVIYYTIKKGDSIASIARKYNITWVQLRKLNGLSKESVLRPGQKIRVK